VRIRYAPCKEKVKEIILKYIKELAGRIDLKTVLLFGSYAKNTYSYGSDVDLLIVAENLPENPIKRVDKLMDESMPFEIQPFAYTPTEFKRMLAENHPLIKGALLHGEILYVSKDYKKVLMEAKGSA